MSNAAKTYPPSAEMAAGAHVNAAKYDAMYKASIDDADGFWREQAQRIDWMTPFTTVKDVDFTFGQVKINWFADGALNVSANCIDRHLETRGDQTAIIWEPDSPEEGAQHITYKELHAQTCKMANILKRSGCAQRRPGRHLSADDPRSRLCHAGLRADRRHPFHRFRRFLARCAWRRGSTDQTPRSSSPPTRPRAVASDAAESQCRPSAAALQGQRQMPGGQAHRRPDNLDRRPRFRLQRTGADAATTAPPRDERRRSAVHPLHLRLDRQPKGVVHTTGGYLVYAAMTHEITFRLPRRRCLLVHRRCGLGHGPQLYRLWPAGQWRDHADVRRRADLSRCRPVLAGLRKAQGQPVLHRPHRHPRADGPGRRIRRKL